MSSKNYNFLKNKYNYFNLSKYLTNNAYDDIMTRIQSIGDVSEQKLVKAFVLIRFLFYSQEVNLCMML